MVRLGVSLAIVASTWLANVDPIWGFSTYEISSTNNRGVGSTTIQQQRRRRQSLSCPTTTDMTRHVTSTSSSLHGFPEDLPISSHMSDSSSSSSSSSIVEEALTNVTTACIESFSNENDSDEDEIALRNQKVQLRQGGTFKVTFPIAKTGANGLNNNNNRLGLTLKEVLPGFQISDMELNVDSLVTSSTTANEISANGLQQAKEQKEDNGWETLDTLEEKIDSDSAFHGVIVNSVEINGLAWKAGIRPGDIVVSTSATLGQAMWPKSSLNGIQSAITSRKTVSKDITIEFKRSTTNNALIQENNQYYQLTLTRPIGLLLKDSEDGYVEVTGCKDTAPNLVKYAVQIGDRVVAVDSSLGDRMWPVSTVEGVISACTSRLPGQQVTIRFERPPSSLSEAEQQKLQLEATASLEVDKQGIQTSIVNIDSAVDEQQQQNQHLLLLRRCQDTLRRFTTEENSEVRTKFMDKFSLPALVATKVMDVLSVTDNISVDSHTLSMIMSAYISCDEADGAIRAFELITGLNGNGSTTTDAKSAKEQIVQEGNENTISSKIKANQDALDLYTASALLQAHAVKKDIHSIDRVLAAIEGRQSLLSMDGETIPAAKWHSRKILAPDTQMYNIAISAAAKGGGKDGFEMAVQLFNSLNDPIGTDKRSTIAASVNGNSATADTNTKPVKDVISYNTILDLLTKQGKYEEAFITFSQMKKAGVKPDKFTYTSLLNACVKDGDIEELLYDMREQHVKPDVFTYNTIIKMLCKEGNIFEAKKLVSEMEHKGIAPDAKTYGLLMNALLKKARKPEACLTLFEAACSDMRTASRVTDSIQLYTTAITAATVMKDHERALDLVSRMNSVGVRPNLKTLTSLLGACLSSNQASLAVQVFEKIKDPDGYALCQGIRAYCADNNMEAASTILFNERKQRRKTRSRYMTGKQIMGSYEALLETSLKNNDYDFARIVFTDLLEKGYIPSKGMISNMIESMGLVTKKGVLMQAASVNLVGNEAGKVVTVDKFNFLLFVFDSLQKRNLPSNGFLYAATVVCGNSLGGTYKKIVSLLKRARRTSSTDFIMESSSSPVASTKVNGATISTAQQKETNGKNEAKTKPTTIVGWEDLVLQFEKYEKELKKTKDILPPLHVQINAQDSKKVFLAERSLNFRPVKTLTKRK